MSLRRGKAFSRVIEVKKGLSVCVFILGLLMTCVSITVMVLGAVGMGKSR